MLQGPEQRVWLRRLDEEHDNLRAALAWSLTTEGSAETAVRLAGALGMFWYVHSHFHEARRWLVVVLERTSGTTARGNPRVLAARAKALAAAGEIARWDDAYRQANALFEESLALYRELEDSAGHRLGVTAARTDGAETRLMTCARVRCWRKA